MVIDLDNTLHLTSAIIGSCTTMIVAVTGLVYAGIRAYNTISGKVEKNKELATSAMSMATYTNDRQDRAWRDQVDRGVLEARKSGQIKLVAGVLRISKVTAKLFDAPLFPEKNYSPTAADKLLLIYRQLESKLGQEPDDYDVMWEILQDKDIKPWILENICLVLGLHNFGCIAVAEVLTRELAGKPPIKATADFANPIPDTATLPVIKEDPVTHELIVKPVTQEKSA